MMQLAVGAALLVILSVLGSRTMTFVASVSADRWRMLVVDTGSFLLAVFSNFLGSVGGVSLAFWLQRHHERRQSTETYSTQLYGCRQELSELRERSEKTQGEIRPGETITASFDAPSLQTLLSSPGIQRHSGRGIFVSVISLSHHLKLVENTLQYFRFASAMGQPLTGPGVAYLKAELSSTERLTEYVQKLLDDELQRLKHVEKVTFKDDEQIGGLMKAARGESR